MRTAALVVALAACGKSSGAEDAAVAPLVVKLYELLDLPLRVRIDGAELTIPARAASAELARPRGAPIAEVTASIDGACGPIPVPIAFAANGPGAIALAIEPPLRWAGLWIDNRGGAGDADVTVGRASFRAPRDQTAQHRLLTTGCTGPLAVAIAGARAGELDPEAGGLVVTADKRCYAAVADGIATDLPAARVYAGPFGGLGTGVVSSRNPTVSSCKGECKGRIAIATDCVASRGVRGTAGTYTLWIDNRGGAAVELAAGAHAIQLVPDEVSFLVRPRAAGEIRIAGKAIGAVSAGSNADYIVDVTGKHCYVRDVRQYSKHLGQRAKYDLRERVRGGKLREVYGIDYFLEEPPATLQASQWETEPSRAFVTDCR